MVGSLGMAGSLISYEAIQPGGNANLVAKVIATEEGGRGSRRSSVGAKDKVTVLLDGNRHIVEALRDALLDRDELIGEEILDVIHGAQAFALGGGGWWGSPKYERMRTPSSMKA